MEDLRFEKIGHYFKQIRLDQGLTQSQLANLLGFKSAQIVSNWERGQCAPPTNSIGELIQHFNLDMNEVLDMITAANRDYLQQEFKRARKKKSAS
ncbi:helix-turn-helix transcriptional regulator [bacterium]|nr:helix-turn-helix transcriptional regulator [bacterium]